MATQYVKTLWLTRKVPFSVVIDGQLIMSESSVGISVENSTGDRSIDVYEKADRALNTMIEKEYELFLNEANFLRLLKHEAKKEFDPEVKPAVEVEVKESHSEKSVDQLLREGIISKGVPTKLKSKPKAKVSEEA